MSFAGVGAGITSMVTSIMGAVALLGGGRLFAGTIQEYVNLNASAKQLSVEMGLNVGDAQALQMTFNRVGVDTETANTALIMMTRQLKNNEVGFNDLGIKTRDASGNLLPLQEVMFNSIGTLKDYREGSDRTEASMVVFGRQAANLPGFLRMTQEAVEETKNHLAQLGLTLDDTSVAKARAFSEGMHDVGLVVTALQYKIGAEAVPLFMELGTLFSDMGPSIVSGLRSGLNSAIDLLTDITVKVAMFRDFFPRVWEALSEGAAATKQVLMETCGTDVVGAFAAGMAAMKQAGEDWREQLVRDANDVRFAVMNARPADVVGHDPDILSQLQNRTKPQASKSGTRTIAAPATGGAGGKAEPEEDLFGEYYKMLGAKRQAEEQEMTASLALLKTTDEQKRAELLKQLQAGLVDAQSYYDQLKGMAAAESAAELALIDKKKTDATAAHNDTLKQINASDASPQMKEYQTYAENQKYAATQAQLNASAAKTQWENQKKVTEELEKQKALRQEWTDSTEKLNIETEVLTGQISEQDAAVRTMYLAWQAAKQKALDAGAAGSPVGQAYLAAGEANYQAKAFDASFMGKTIKDATAMLSSGFGDLANCLMKGGKDFSTAVEQFGQKLEQDTFKLFFKDLSDAFTQGIKSLVSDIQQAMQNNGGSFFKAAGSVLSNIFGGGGDEGFGIMAGGSSAHGHAFDRGRAMAFAAGGIVTRPTLFPMATGQGLMGEAGPEGILPLSRVGGDLGVKALLPQAGPTEVKVINNLGVEAQATASFNDDGSLDIILEKKVTNMVAMGGPLQSLLTTLYGPKKGF